VNEKDENGFTALPLAAVRGNKDICQLLILNAANVNEKNHFGSTPLHLAAANGQKDTCQLLIQNGANVNEKDEDGKTPLHWAIEKGHKETAKLLEDFSTILNAKDLPRALKLYHEIFNRNRDPFPSLKEVAGVSVKALNLHNNNKNLIPTELLKYLEQPERLSLLFKNHVVKQGENIAPTLTPAQSMSVN